MKQQFLPVSREDMRARGWDAPDFVYVCGDAYVDHPSFGHSIISRVLENAGYRVAMLCLPPWQDESAFMEFGRPKLGFLVSAGVIDSMEPLYRRQEAPQRGRLRAWRQGRHAPRPRHDRLLQQDPAGVP